MLYLESKISSIGKNNLFKINKIIWKIMIIV